MATLLYRAPIGPIVKYPILGLYIDGTENTDSLYGTAGGDSIHGHGGNDYLSGGAGDDALYGDEGNDSLAGGTGNDLLDGGIGDDLLNGGSGADTFVGGLGYDTVTYASATIGVMVDMTTVGITNDAQGDTYSGIEAITGSQFGDIISGDANANLFYGNAGDDFLFGHGGNDTLKGGEGDDQLRGGAGNDTLIGGLGMDRLTGDDSGQFFADTFVLVKNSSVDIVTDFQSGIDKIKLAGFGNTPFGWDGQLAYGGGYVGEEFYFGGIDGADTMVYNPTNNTLYEVALAWDTDEGAWYITQSTEIAKFTNGVDLHASDFML